MISKKHNQKAEQFASDDTANERKITDQTADLRDARDHSTKNNTQTLSRGNKKTDADEEDGDLIEDDNNNNDDERLQQLVHSSEQNKEEGKITKPEGSDVDVKHTILEEGTGQYTIDMGIAKFVSLFNRAKNFSKSFIDAAIKMADESMRRWFSAVDEKPGVDMPEIDEMGLGTDRSRKRTVGMEKMVRRRANKRRKAIIASLYYRRNQMRGDASVGDKLHQHNAHHDRVAHDHRLQEAASKMNLAMQNVRDGNVGAKNMSDKTTTSSQHFERAGARDSSLTIAAADLSASTAKSSQGAADHNINSGYNSLNLVEAGGRFPVAAISTMGPAIIPAFTAGNAAAQASGFMSLYSSQVNTPNGFAVAGSSPGVVGSASNNPINVASVGLARSVQINQSVSFLSLGVSGWESGIAMNYMPNTLTISHNIINNAFRENRNPMISDLNHLLNSITQHNAISSVVNFSFSVTYSNPITPDPKGIEGKPSSFVSVRGYDNFQSAIVRGDAGDHGGGIAQ